MPLSVLRLLVDKSQGLQSGICVVLPPIGMLSRELTRSALLLWACFSLSLLLHLGSLWCAPTSCCCFGCLVHIQ